MLKLFLFEIVPSIQHSQASYYYYKLNLYVLQFIQVVD